jgi:probable HAF family extracellular repeat protein
MSRLASFLCSAFAATTLFAAAAAHSQTYLLTDLGTLGSSQSYGKGISSTGQVVGYGFSPSAASDRAFRSTASGVSPVKLTDIGTLGGDFTSHGNGINASGQVTGDGNLSGDGSYHAFRSSASGSALGNTDLGTLGGTYSTGYGINATGQVTGQSTIPGNVIHAFRSSANGSVVLTDLGTLGGTYSYGVAINDSGEATGNAATANNSTQHAFRSSATASALSLTDLGTLGGTSSAGQGINASGQVTGNSQTTFGAFHAFLSSASGSAVALTDLGTLGGSSSSGQSINSFGVVVGVSATAANVGHAFLYNNNVMLDLNALVTNLGSFVLVDAYGINDAGAIAGTGNINGSTHAYRLDPRVSSATPEPGTLALFAAFALTGAGFARKRRRK